MRVNYHATHGAVSGMGYAYSPGGPRPGQVILSGYGAYGQTTPLTHLPPLGDYGGPRAWQRKIKRLDRKIAKLKRKMARGRRGLFGKKQDRLARRLAKYQMRKEKWQSRLQLQAGGGAALPTTYAPAQDAMMQEAADDEFDDLGPMPAPPAGGTPNWLLPVALGGGALVLVLVLARGRG